MREGAVFEVTLGVRAGDPVAVKRPRRQLADDARAEAALAREAAFLSLADHPSVPKLVATGSDARGPFVVEERVDGVTLESMLDEAEAPLPRAFVVHVVREAALALRALHDRADAEGPLTLVHGDPSPANLMVSTAGVVRFVDFGASRFRGERALLEGFTGTVPYAAPEVARAEVSVSRETDVYALAAVAIRLFSGRPLRPEPSAAARLLAVAERGLDLAPLREARLPARLEEALRALVVFDARARSTSLDALVDLLADPR